MVSYVTKILIRGCFAINKTKTKKCSYENCFSHLTQNKVITAAMKRQAKPPEKKTKRTTNASSPTPSSSSPSLSSLPDEIVENCLARISRSYYPTLSIVSKSFRSIISSTELYVARSHLRNTEECVYVCLSDKSFEFPKWFTLWVNPNQANSMVEKKRKKKKTIGKLLVPIPSSNLSPVSKSAIAVGSEIYVIGGKVDGALSSAVRILDCRSNTWRDAPSMTVARKRPFICLYDGKIYVIGGYNKLSESEPWAEVFDIKTQTWECLSDPGTEIRNCTIYRIAEIEGKIHFGYTQKTYAYDPKQGEWECCEGEVAFPRSQCVMESVLYTFANNYTWEDDYGCKWWSTDGYGEKVKGLESLLEIHKRNGGSSDNTTKLVACGGKLLLLWEGYMKHNPNNRKKIWCAVIALEKRDGGKVWGIVEWVDVVHIVPTSCKLLHCLVVSV